MKTYSMYVTVGVSSRAIIQYVWYIYGIYLIREGHICSRECSGTDLNSVRTFQALSIAVLCSLYSLH